MDNLPPQLEMAFSQLNALIEKATGTYIGLIDKHEKTQANQQRIIIFLTAALVVTTLAYAVITGFSLQTMKRANELEEKKIKIEQTLNRPLCGIEKIDVLPTGEQIQISVFIKNYGSYLAKDTLISWKTYVVENLKSDKITRTEIPTLQSKRDIPITVLPKQEFKYFLFYVEKENFKKAVKGYDSAVELELNIKYKKTKDEPGQYSCLYRITRLLTDDRDEYEKILLKAKVI